MKNKPKTKAIFLLVLFVISYIALSVIAFAVSIIRTIETGVFTTPGNLEGYHLFTFIVTAIYFIPLSIQIRLNAKLSGLKWINIIGNFLLVVMIGTLILGVCSTIISWFI